MVKHYLFFLVAFITFFLDRITKYFVTDVDITSFFSLNLVKNYGVGFGLFQHQFLIIVLVSIGVIGAIGYYYNNIDTIPWKDKTEATNIIHEISKKIDSGDYTLDEAKNAYFNLMNLIPQKAQDEIKKKINVPIL